MSSSLSMSAAGVVVPLVATSDEAAAGDWLPVGVFAFRMPCVQRYLTIIPLNIRSGLPHDGQQAS